MKPATCHPSKPHHAHGLCALCYSRTPERRAAIPPSRQPEAKRARNAAYKALYADELREERKLKYAAQRPERLAKAAAERAAKRAARVPLRECDRIRYR